jgi:hypothetical protein
MIDGQKTQQEQDDFILWWNAYTGNTSKKKRPRRTRREFRTVV